MDNIVETWFINHYEHCSGVWVDEWFHASNDACPDCGKEIEPFLSEEAD